MKRLLSYFALLAVVSLPSVLAADSRLVKLRILDRDKPQSGVEVLVNYPDDQRTSGTTITLTTDADGFVQFTLAEHVFWVTVPSLNRDVVGRRFNVAKSAGRQLRWDVRPREWKKEVHR